MVTSRNVAIKRSISKSTTSNGSVSPTFRPCFSPRVSVICLVNYSEYQDEKKNSPTFIPTFVPKTNTLYTKSLYTNKVNQKDVNKIVKEDYKLVETWGHYNIYQKNGKKYKKHKWKDEPMEVYQ